MKNRIALKLFAYFSIAIVAFALVSGLLFQTLFTQQTIETKKAEMLARATSIAGALTKALNETGSGGMGSGQGMGGYGAYVRAVSALEANIWVLDENLQFLTAGHMMGQTLQYGDLPSGAETLVKGVFSGQTPFSEGFSDLLGTPTLTVGAPIYQGQTVAGALLLHDAVSGIEAASLQGMRLLLYSGAAALLVAVLLSVALSLSFAKPINRMKTTALLLTEGDYAAKTNVRQKDEIGKLAQAIDGLSDRLLEARKAAERQEQLRRSFLANVSHELRTPVTVLRASLEALCDGVVDSAEQVSAYHRQMLGETVGLQRLVNDLMDLARLQNVDFPMEQAPLMLNEALGDALYSAGQIARDKHIRLLRELPAEGVAFTGDYGRLRQMFLIVLDNAVKFSPAGGAVTATLTRDSVSIRDEGPGIAPEELSLIFDRFHKAQTAENKNGSGLGLAIAREIAMRHGMTLTVESEPGHGATFRFQWNAQTEVQNETGT
ncbi:MAG TPA: ATP-binding protein [Candidatus Limiplasma sp.]|nr:ATP-binding protein [Candidatus Limiplasma sp.]